MASEQQIDKALKSDDAFEHRISMSHDDRMARYQDNGLPSFVEPLSEEVEQKLKELFVPTPDK